MVYEIFDGYVTFKMPVVRRVYPSLMANNIVSVQPMSVPVGNIFYHDGYTGIWLDEMLRNDIEILKEDIFAIRTKFVGEIKAKHDQVLLRVVKEYFPQHLEMLEKLLVLK